MKKLLRGLLGSGRDLLDGGAKVSLSNLQYYENLKQALLELQRDTSYSIYYWDFSSTFNVIRKEFSSNDEIFKTNMVISLEISKQTQQREVYIRKFRSFYPDYDKKGIEIRTPVEKETNVNEYICTHGKDYAHYSDRRIFYIMGHSGLRGSFQQHDAFEYYRDIKETFDRMQKQ